MILSMFATLGGCSRDARLAGQHVRDAAAHPLTAYGVRLDESASPSQVVYVFLKAVVDDYKAGSDRKARDKALDVQFGVAAPDTITASDPRNVRANDEDKKEHLFRTIYHWAPTVGHYRASFSGDLNAIKPRMREEIDPTDPTKAQVFVNMFNPADPDRQRTGVVAWFLLTREHNLWRIYWVGFDPSSRDWNARLPKNSYAVTRPTRRGQG